MSDRLSLANALTDAKIDRPAAERIATEIYEAIHDSVATKADLERLEAGTKAELIGVRNEIAGLRNEMKGEIAGLRSEMSLRLTGLEHRLTVRFSSVMVVLIGLLFAALRYLPPPR